MAFIMKSSNGSSTSGFRSGAEARAATTRTSRLIKPCRYSPASARSGPATRRPRSGTSTPPDGRRWPSVALEPAQTFTTSSTKRRISTTRTAVRTADSTTVHRRGIPRVVPAASRLTATDRTPPVCSCSAPEPTLRFPATNRIVRRASGS
uniref:(northern house mosquito) hypothetical protein n=1 Tax=Culex pipiens TaxID=7175 RepID=A0A8D8IKB7_CULPI